MTINAVSRTLAERFNSGEELAFTEAYHRYVKAMFVAALNLLGNRDLAAEAVQQAFIKAWQGHHTFDPDRDLKAWLYTITRRAAIDIHRRTRRTREETSLDGEATNAVTVDPPSLERIWRIWEVRRAVQQLGERERGVLQLSYFQQLTHSEIGSHLGIPLGTVKSRMTRAQRQLAQLLTHVAPAGAGSKTGD